VRYPQPIRRAGSYAAGLLGLVRRRREDRRPRVRVRIAHGETHVLAEDAPTRERLLSLAEQLVGEYGKQARGER
jgi:hypothetical protein